MSTKTCFVISPIGEEGSETRKRADQVLKHVIYPAVGACGYIAVRADQMSEPGLITSQVIQHIIDDPLVVADLTGSNPNVFYELAVRHAIRKPLVQIIQKGEKIPFDVAGMRTIPIDHRDLDSVEDAKTEISKQIKAVEGKKPEQIDSPISASVELQSLRQSNRSEDRSLADILSGISQLRADVAAMDKLLTERDRIFQGGLPGTPVRNPILRRIYELEEEIRQAEKTLEATTTQEGEDLGKFIIKSRQAELEKLNNIVLGPRPNAS